ncbi:Gfo/Idh/MocA family oxidoreductase [Microbacterium aoyamense]|uniref:Gfo/Idh/MocA family oxidoreductase n=1 Tax=Microbacterium aoyamense TaxID=344166 RepID=A0ABN2PDQ3_9MICO|nr:Gfo/Idh/MocA family oxidoreductase [Microbacterium aoyamense]
MSYRDPFPNPGSYTAGSGEPRLRWGILAPGGIAAAFATALRAHTTQSISAVASRSAERAEKFAARFEVPRFFASYNALVEDPSIDVVYVAAPASEHRALGLLAMAAGKHVVIEKPLAISVADAVELVAASREHGVFLMEAMWTRYLPQTAVINELVTSGRIGEPRGIIADHWQAIPDDPSHRLYRPELGGGALLDLGIYPIQLDSMVLGAPDAVFATGVLATTGVDAFSTLVLDHGGSRMSSITSSLLARSSGAASIIGTEGRIDIDGPAHIPTSFTLRGIDLNSPQERWTDPSGLTRYAGLSWEITAAATFIGDGLRQSPVHTLEECIQILTTIEMARTQLGTVGVVAEVAR